MSKKCVILFRVMRYEKLNLSGRVREFAYVRACMVTVRLCMLFVFARVHAYVNVCPRGCVVARVGMCVYVRSYVRVCM